MVILITVCSEAAIIERSLIVDIDDSMIENAVDPEGNPGKKVRIDNSVLSFNLSEGDLIKTHVSFAEPILIEQRPENEFYTYLPTNTVGSERISMHYWFWGNNQADLSINATAVFNITAGNPQTTVINQSYGSSGDGFSFYTTPWGPQGNLTDSYIILRGIDVETEITRMSQSLKVSRYSFILEASDLYVVPEPATVSLLALGGLTLLGKRNKSE